MDRRNFIAAGLATLFSPKLPPIEEVYGFGILTEAKAASISKYIRIDSCSMRIPQDRGLIEKL